MYKYIFDETTAGHWGISRDEYKQVHECHKTLLARIEEWNQIAVKNGALEEPYHREVADLKQMVEWGEKKLQDENNVNILFHRISIGSLRYTKAALLYCARVREEEAQKEEKHDWPSAVKSAVRDSGNPLRNFADKIDYPPADILEEIDQTGNSATGNSASEWDAFISHASEDKHEFVEQLVQELKQRGLEIWYDNLSLKIGDSLRRSIDLGLARSRYGIVVLSPSFFAKEWPQKELDGLVAREVNGRKVILPLWHNIDKEKIREYSPLLADRVAVSSSIGVEKVVDSLVEVINT